MRRVELLNKVKQVAACVVLTFAQFVQAMPLLPDFVVTDIICPSEILAGMDMTVYVTVENQGVAAGEGMYVDLWQNITNSFPNVGEVGEAWEPVGMLEPGEARTIAISPIEVLPGTNQIFALVEFENRVSEALNTNNLLCVEYQGVATSSIQMLENKTPAKGISGLQGSIREYIFEAPLETEKLTITTSGGTGDCDIYVRYGGSAAETEWDYSSQLSGNQETITINSPMSGYWYITVYGQSDYVGVVLTGTRVWNGDSELQPIGAPTGVMASDGEYTNRVVVTWNEVQNATHYRVYRSESATGVQNLLSSWQVYPEFNDFDALPGRTYYYSIVAVPLSTVALPSTRSTSNPGWRGLVAPTGINASDGAYAGRVAVSWDAVDGASHYRLYRSETPDGPLVDISAWDTKRWFWDLTGAPGRSYYYFVRAAVDINGSRAGATSGPEEGWRLLPGPTGVVASDGSTDAGVSVSWQPLSGATRYRVSRADEDGSLVELGVWQSGTHYLDTECEPGRTSQYFVRAAVGDDGWRSGILSASDAGWRKLPAPILFTASDGVIGRIAMSWSSVPGATHYRVYRSETPFGIRVALAGWATKLWFWDVSAIPGRTYYYFVQAAAGADGYRAGSLSAAESGWRALTPPSSVVATDGAYFGNVTITWQPVPNATHYRVMVSDVLGVGGTPLSDWQTALSFRDYFGAPGYPRYYTVQAAVDADGTYSSAASAADSGWRKLSAPAMVVATDGELLDQVSISWEAVSGASHYQVYRSELPDGVPEEISTWSTELSFEDQEALPGRTYNYFVRASTNNQGGFPGAFSEAESGWRAMQAPALPTASDGTAFSYVGISWSAVPGATHYRVYRSVALDGEKTPVSNWDSKCWFRDTGATPAQTFYYFVQADSGGAGERVSGFSPADTGWRMLPPPTGVSASDGPYYGNVTITWQAVQGATHYAVFRSSESGEGSIQISSWQENLVFRDYTALPGANHYYSVRAALDSEGWRSGFSSTADAGWRKIPPPTGLSATDGAYTDRTVLTWPEAPGAYCYRVYRAETLNGPKTALAGWVSRLWFWDTSGVSGRTYYYFIQAAAGSGGIRPGVMSAAEPGWRGGSVSSAPAVSSISPLEAPLESTSLEVTWYVDATGGNDSGDGAEWGTAKRTLQSAVDAAADGDTILVASGIYEPIDTGGKILFIDAVEGSEVTVIDGGCILRCATLGSDVFQAGTRLRGFTLRNGHAELGGGAIGGTLEGCRLEGNIAVDGGGAFGSTLFDCVLTRNTAEFGGGACESSLVKCTVVGNVSTVAGGELYNCENVDSAVDGEMNGFDEPEN